MGIAKLLIANRGEIAIRIMRAARELGITSVAVHPADDTDALHGRMADERAQLPGAGAAAYLDMEAILTAAREHGCDAIHPGYGFLAENAEFAERCRKAGMIFVGPRTELLRLFGDKLAAREAARSSGVPLLAATASATSVEEAREFLASLGPDGAMVIKAVAGGGGRGMRVVTDVDALDATYRRCRSEAESAFGNGALYVEELVPRARHIEVQIVGDGLGRVTALGERDCTIQRRHQKLVEIAPAPFFPDALRQRIIDAALLIAGEAGYDNVGTFEFLVDAEKLTGESRFAFIEANPRLQVEHTVTEEVHGVDLVEIQLAIAAGASLGELPLPPRKSAPAGYSMQLRVNMERMDASGRTVPGSGRIAALELPAGPGVRVDAFGYAGYETSGLYDPLLAKVIATKPGAFEHALARAYRALCECRIEGVPSNLELLRNLLCQPVFTDGAFYTRYVDEHVAELLGDRHRHPVLYSGAPAGDAAARAAAPADTSDRVSTSSYGESGRTELGHQLSASPQRVDGAVPVRAPMRGVLLSIEVAEGEIVDAGATVAIMESMKMEHEVFAPQRGIVRDIAAEAKASVSEGQPLCYLAPAGETVNAGN